MTLEQQLKHYITNLFNLPRDEVWHCESIEEIADDILPNQYVRLGPLSNKTLQTNTYYSDTLHESNIYPFILYYQKQLIAIGYIDENLIPTQHYHASFGSTILTNRRTIKCINTSKLHN